MRALHLALRNLKELLRDPLSAILGVAMPAVLLVLFSQLGGSGEIEIFSVAALVPGIAVFGYAFLVMFGSMLLARDRASAFMDRLLMSPMVPSGFIVAYALPLLLLAVLQTIVVSVIGVILGLRMIGWIVSALPAFLLTALFAVSLGMVLGSLLTETQIAAAGSLFIVVASLFGGAWMDLDAIGGVFLAIGRVLPFYHAVGLARRAAEVGVGGANASLGWVVGHAVGMFGLAAVVFATRMRRR